MPKTKVRQSQGLHGLGPEIVRPISRVRREFSEGEEVKGMGGNAVFGSWKNYFSRPATIHGLQTQRRANLKGALGGGRAPPEATKTSKKPCDIPKIT